MSPLSRERRNEAIANKCSPSAHIDPGCLETAMRYSRFTALVKVPSRDTAVVVAALTRHVRKLPAALPRSLTWDRGLENAQNKSFTVATERKVSVCEPHRAL